MTPATFKAGQKWISNAEPDLGMGTILQVEQRLVTISFDLVDEVRRYARDQAPLTRVRFNTGDSIKTVDGIEITIERVTDRDDIIFYHGSYQGTATAVIETELHPNVTFSKPEERLFTHQFEDNRWYNLRHATLAHKARLADMPAKGLLGPRVSLIPHQLYIAQAVADRFAPRVLLADEVGLGKTIEAGLIISKQLTSGRASRVLIIVPPALTFQWFVEMIRRFNLQFTILDEDRCLQIEADNRPEFEDDEPELDNPFEAQQLVLCSLDLFLENPERLVQGATAEWDLVVVDEAHHLHWQEDEPGPDYQVVEILAEHTAGLLLLTATPEQLGRLGHFSRLRLLDPSRYHDYQEFLNEETGYEEVALLIKDIEAGELHLDADTRQLMQARLGDTTGMTDRAMVNALLDRHGTGRVLFRNVRESVAGFPDRELKAYELDPAGFPASDAGSWSPADVRTDWLTELLESTEEKFLVICSKAETAIALDRYLGERTTLRSVAFHEGLDLVARDRAANYFADTERGAQVLICSEIGSEGRNFQFAHHLVMFDLPASPDLIEQRIGRLDRIGQQHNVMIHVPYAAGSRQHFLLRLIDEGLNLFDGPNAAAQLVFDELGELDTRRAGELVNAAREQSLARAQAMRQGRDRLIELNSHDPGVSASLVQAINAADSSQELEDYLEASFELFGLESEPLTETTWRVRPTEGMVRHSPVSLETQDRYRYPELPEEGIAYTYDRDTALAREDIQFLTWENPLVEQALDLVASDTTGNSTVIAIKIQGVPAGTMLLEALHVIDCIAPAHLGAARFLPPAVVRSLITPQLKDVSESVPFSPWSDALDISRDALVKIVSQQEKGIRTMITQAEAVAEGKFEPIRADALARMTEQLASEVSRLKALAEVNPNVRPDEIAFLENQRAQLTEAIDKSQVRLDAVRLIIAA
ncbi:MAG: RNA polymerase-associated protein RapA [Gammaproteobacteria bacterium]